MHHWRQSSQQRQNLLAEPAQAAQKMLESAWKWAQAVAMQQHGINKAHQERQQLCFIYATEAASKSPSALLFQAMQA